MDFRKRLRSIWKRLLSYRKATWDFSDYPLTYRMQKLPQNVERDEGYKLWVVQIVGWELMIGLGDTKEEAYEKLQSSFKRYIVKSPAPRPGTKVPIEFASRERIKILEEVAATFFYEILGVNFYECIVTDDSTLADFKSHDPETFHKINTLYSLDLDDSSDGNIVSILTAIEKQRLKSLYDSLSARKN